MLPSTRFISPKFCPSPPALTIHRSMDPPSQQKPPPVHATAYISLRHRVLSEVAVTSCTRPSRERLAPCPNSVRFKEPPAPWLASFPVYAYANSSAASATLIPPADGPPAEHVVFTPWPFRSLPLRFKLILLCDPFAILAALRLIFPQVRCCETQQRRSNHARASRRPVIAATAGGWKKCRGKMPRRRSGAGRTQPRTTQPRAASRRGWQMESAATGAA